MKVYEFATKIDTLHSGEKVFTPVVRTKQNRWIPFLAPEWNRITCIYGVYSLQNIDFTPSLTLEQCKEHIEGYKKVLEIQNASKIKDIEFHELEEVTI